MKALIQVRSSKADGTMWSDYAEGETVKKAWRRAIAEMADTLARDDVHVRVEYKPGGISVSVGDYTGLARKEAEAFGMLIYGRAGFGHHPQARAVLTDSGSFS